MKTPGAVPTTEQAVWGVGSARKPRAPSQKPVLSGLAVASDPIGFWEGGRTRLCCRDTAASSHRQRRTCKKKKTTRTTCSSPSTTSMTTLTHCTCTSTDAWRTCTETARASVFHSIVMIHAHLMAQVLSAFHSHLHSIHGALSLIRLLPFLLPLPPPNQTKPNQTNQTSHFGSSHFIQNIVHYSNSC